MLNHIHKEANHVCRRHRGIVIHAGDCGEVWARRLEKDTYHLNA